MAALAVSSAASAQIIDKVQTKNGSYYNGFISEQVPGSQVMVYAENASIVFKKKDMTNQRKDYYDFSRLTESSKEIIRNHCDTASLQLASFEYKGTYYENMYLGEAMDSTVRALALTPRTYIIPWNDLLKTSRVSLNTEPYGIRDIVTLKSGERMIGQITEQEIGKTMLLKDQNGVSHMIKASEVLSIMSERISDKYSLWEQSPLLDRIVLDNGTSMDGFITSRLLGQHISLLMRYSHDAQQISMKNIKKYQKTRNAEYKVFAPDTAKVIMLNNIKVVPVSLEKEEGAYAQKDTLEHTYFVGSDLKLALKNVSYAKTAALYEYTEVQEKSSIMDIIKKDKKVMLEILESAQPIYETPFIEEDGYMVCNLVARKPGKYFLTIDGFNAGLNLVFVNKSEKEEK